MDNRPQLPSITTHFAEYFPNHKANTAPVTPPGGQFPVQSPFLKRKRSDPTDVAGEAGYRPTKQPFNPSSSSWPEPARSHPSGRDSTYESSQEIQRRTDSAQELSFPNQTYPKAAYSPRRSNNVGYRSEQIREEARRPVSASAASGSTLDDRPRTSHAHESQPVQARLLPPITGLEPSPASATAETWRNPWRQEPKPSLPHVIEPRTQYQPLDREASNRLDQHREPRGMKRERSPNLDRPLDDIKTPRRQHQDHHYNSDVTPYRRMAEPVSPTSVRDRPRSMHGIQAMPARPSAWDQGPSSQHTSPSDPSPTSAHPALESSTRYSWDPSSLYDNMRSVRKRRGNLPKESTALLNEWYNQHASYPYPKEAEKQDLQSRTGLAMSQISNWFINARRRRRPSASSRTAEGLPRTLAFDFSARKD